jgi:two-component sensor histidine kinase
MAHLDSGGDSANQLRKQRAALADFGQKAFQSGDLDDVLHRAAELVSQALGVRLVKVLEYLPEEHKLLVRAGVNWNPGVVGKAKIGADLESPAGYALQFNEPVVSEDVAAETRFRIPELLVEHGVKSMVNVIIQGDDKPFGVLEVDATERSPFTDDDIAFLRNYTNLLAAAIDRIRAHETLTQAVEERELLTNELRHRVRNLLALVQSLASQTKVEGRTADEYKASFLGRLRALERAEGIAFEKQTGDADLRELMEHVLEPYLSGPGDAISLAGEPVALGARQVRMLALVVHELATNATKYGGLSVPEGRVEVSWHVVEEDTARVVRFAWRERNGPPVTPPRSSGFGSRLIERAAALELGGKTELRYPPAGLECDIAFDLG